MKNKQAGFIKPLLLTILAVLMVPGICTAMNKEAKKEAMPKAVESAGKAVYQPKERAPDLASLPVEVRKINDFIYYATGIGNTFLIVTSEGNVVFDTGLDIQAAKQMRLLKEAVSENKVTHLVLSHSHADHIGGTKFWKEDGTEVIAHRQFPEEQHYLKELWVFSSHRNRAMFPWIVSIHLGLLSINIMKGR